MKNLYPEERPRPQGKARESASRPKLGAFRAFRPIDLQEQNLNFQIQGLEIKDHSIFVQAKNGQGFVIQTAYDQRRLISRRISQYVGFKPIKLIAISSRSHTFQLFKNLLLKFASAEGQTWLRLKRMLQVSGSIYIQQYVPVISLQENQFLIKKVFNEHSYSGKQRIIQLGKLLAFDMLMHFQARFSVLNNQKAFLFNRLSLSYEAKTFPFNMAISENCAAGVLMASDEQTSRGGVEYVREMGKVVQNILLFLENRQQNQTIKQIRLQLQVDMRLTIQKSFLRLFSIGFLYALRNLSQFRQELVEDVVRMSKVDSGEQPNLQTQQAVFMMFEDSLSRFKRLSSQIDQQTLAFHKIFQKPKSFILLQQQAEQTKPGQPKTRVQSERRLEQTEKGVLSLIEKSDRQSSIGQISIQNEIEQGQLRYKLNPQSRHSIKPTHQKKQRLDRPLPSVQQNFKSQNQSDSHRREKAKENSLNMQENSLNRQSDSLKRQSEGLKKQSEGLKRQSEGLKKQGVKAESLLAQGSQLQAKLARFKRNNYA